jgi:hypothetical protein
MLIIVNWSTNDLYFSKIKLEKDYMIIIIVWWPDFYNPTHDLTRIQTPGSDNTLKAHGDTYPRYQLLPPFQIIRQHRFVVHLNIHPV